MLIPKTWKQVIIFKLPKVNVSFFTGFWFNAWKKGLRLKETKYIFMFHPTTENTSVFPQL